MFSNTELDSDFPSFWSFCGRAFNMHNIFSLKFDNLEDWIHAIGKCLTRENPVSFHKNLCGKLGNFAQLALKYAKKRPLKQGAVKS